MTGNVYPNLVKVFYTNLSLEGRNMVSSIKGTKLLITNQVWSNIVGIKYTGVNVGRGNIVEIQKFNKMQFYRTCLQDPAHAFTKFHVGTLKLTPRLLAFVIAWQLTPRGSNHAILHEEDFIFMYCLMNKIKVNICLSGEDSFLMIFLFQN